MNNITHTFFTGKSCSGCVVIKNRIEALGLTDRFEFIDVEENALAAHQNSVRSLPTIVTANHDYYIGSNNCSEFVSKLTRS